MTTLTLAAIYRYPVKGLSADPMALAHLATDETLPFDRAYAIENGPSRFDPFAPRHVPKSSFLTIMRNAALAALETRFEPDTRVLGIFRDGQQVAKGCLTTSAGRAIIAQFFSEYLKDELRGPPRIVHAEGHSISDVAARCLHIVNADSVADLERLAGQPISAGRFRPNLVVSGAPPHAELDWVGRTLRIGAAELSVFKRTGRCAATTVDPLSGCRDIDLPALLQRHWGHSDVGVYARVTKPGRIAPGEVCTLD